MTNDWGCTGEDFAGDLQGPCETLATETLATKNLLEDTDGLRRPPLEGGGDAIHQCPLDAVACCFC